MPDVEGAVGDALVEHFFRRRHTELVAALTRVFGVAELDLVEDVVQHALMRAVETWRIQGPPDRPAAWLHRVARNRALDILRRRRVADMHAQDLASIHDVDEDVLDVVFESHEIEDSKLRMIFTCCDPNLPVASQLALSLKVLCGFATTEVAAALLIEPENAKKRITRAKRAFATGRVAFEVPGGDELPPRREAVHAVLYALFTAGYYSEHPDGLVRRELCFEAIHLAECLSRHDVAASTTSALLALMYFHAARLPARLDGRGGVLLLEEQDRAQWDRTLLSRGAEALAASATGSELSRYHLEAGIAAKHALASSMRDTDWRGVLALYDLLMGVVPSPITALNRAVALAFVEGPDAGIAVIQRLTELPTLRDRYPLVEEVLGGLHLMAGRPKMARIHFERAAGRAHRPVIQAFLERQLRRCDGHDREVEGRLSPGAGLARR